MFLGREHAGRCPVAALIQIHGAAGCGRGPALPIPQGGPADASSFCVGDTKRADSERDARRSSIRPQLTHQSGNGGGEKWKEGRSDPGTGTIEKKFVQTLGE